MAANKDKDTPYTARRPVGWGARTYRPRIFPGRFPRLMQHKVIPVIPGRTREVLLRPSLVPPVSGLDQNDGLDGALRFIRTHSRSNITGNNAAGKGVGPESRWSEHTRARHERATLSPTRSPWRARRPGDALQTATTTCPAKCSYRPSSPSPCGSTVSPGELPQKGANNSPPGGIRKSQLCYFLIGQKARTGRIRREASLAPWRR